MIQKNKTFLFLIIILVLACFFRLWQLEIIPPGLWPDEAAYANDAIKSLETNSFKLFYPDNHGREGLFMWILAFSFSIFGISIWSFKIIPALIGILTVLGQYFLGLEFFRTIKFEEKKVQIAAFLSSFFLAISFWHINFSRIGFRAILLPFILVFSFYFLLRGLRTKSISNFLLSGIFFGLGFHTYISFRLAVLVFGFILIFWFIVALKERWIKRYIMATSLLLITVFIVALPMGLYFLENPEDFMSRAMGVSVFEQENPILSFFQSFFSHLIMFNFQGDFNWRHNFSGIPQLFFLAGIFFLIGVFWALKQIFLFFKNKEADKLKKLGAFLFLFTWLFSLLLPSMLTIEGIPHALRSIGVIPAAYLFSGLGACLVYQLMRNKWGKNKTNKFFAAILTIMVFSSFFSYFIFWANHPEAGRAFTKRFVDVGMELNALPLETKKYVIKNEGDLPTETSRFIQKTANRDEAIYIEPWQAEVIDFHPGNFIFIMNKEAGFLYHVQERFPDGILHKKERILIYEIK